ncbi:hypothetical protein D3C74_354960 [compost metagenome]
MKYLTHIGWICIVVIEHHFVQSEQGLCFVVFIELQSEAVSIRILHRGYGFQGQIPLGGETNVVQLVAVHVHTHILVILIERTFKHTLPVCIINRYIHINHVVRLEQRFISLCHACTRGCRCALCGKCRIWTCHQAKR